MDTLFIQIRKCIENQLEQGNAKFIIYPYGDVGTQVKAILNTSYGITEAYIIDGKLWKYNQNVKPLEFLAELDCSEYVLLLASTNPEIYEALKSNALKYFAANRIAELECMLEKNNGMPKWETKIGKHSYGPICRDHIWIKSIGAFCSFAFGVDVVPNHEMQYITIHPIVYMGQRLEEKSIPYFNYKNLMWYMEGVQPKRDRIKKQKRITIGNDVWFGRNVTVTNGANIGNGVIAGAGAVITKDVPDYAVVAGVPARILRYRYTPEQIEALNKIKWWDWTDDEIRERYDDLYLPIEEFIAKYL